jgi:hypothetical protein
MNIGDGVDSVRQRLDMLERSVAALRRHEFASLPGRMLGEVRKLSASVGEIIVEAVERGALTAPAGSEIDYPWLAIARGRLTGRIVSASCRGYSVRLGRPQSCRDALASLADMQRDYEQRFGIEAALHIDVANEILHRHVLYEALTWLPSIESALSFPQDIELEDADGTRIRMIADWMWEESSVSLELDETGRFVAPRDEPGNSEGELMLEVERRKDALLAVVGALKDALAEEPEIPTVQALWEPRALAASPPTAPVMALLDAPRDPARPDASEQPPIPLEPKVEESPDLVASTTRVPSKSKARSTVIERSSQALPGREATEVVLWYDFESAYPIQVKAPGTKKRLLLKPPRLVVGVLRKALEAAITQGAKLSDEARGRLHRNGFEPGALLVEPGGSRAEFLGWWNQVISDGDALVPGGASNVYAVNWRMALSWPE